MQIINSAVLTLPITVIGREVPPPTFSSSTIDVVAGEDAKIIDLTALTHSPAGTYEDEKQYAYPGHSAYGEQVVQNYSAEQKQNNVDNDYSDFELVERLADIEKYHKPDNGKKHCSRRGDVVRRKIEDMPADNKSRNRQRVCQSRGKRFKQNVFHKVTLYAFLVRFKRKQKAGKTYCEHTYK